MMEATQIFIPARAVPTSEARSQKKLSRPSRLPKRLAAAKNAFLSALDTKTPPFACSEMDSSPPPPAVGYLVNAAITLPLYPNVTFIYKTADGLRSAPESPLGGEVLLVLRQSRSENCFFLGDSNRESALYHGKEIVCADIRLTLRSFSSDLCDREERHDL